MQKYPLNERGYSLYHSLAQDLKFEQDQPYVFDLDHLTTLDLIGENAAVFLQGQVTTDVHAVTEEHMRPSGICSLQGRLVALLDIIKWNTHFHLILPKDLGELTQSTLAKAGLFSRVSLKINTSFSYVGIYLPSSAQFNPAFSLPKEAWQVSQNTDHYCYALSEHLWIVLMRDAQSKETFLAQFSAQQQRGSLAWHYLELQQRHLSIYPNTRGLFLPHRLNLQMTPYLSFSKGCYKGQEIIARTHYRAKLKHHLELLSVQSAEPFFAGQKCFKDKKQTELGEIVDFCPIDEQNYLIAISIVIEHPESVYFEGHLSPVTLSL